MTIQSHNYRSEYWVVVKGTGIATTLNDKQIELKKVDCISIKIKDKHRMSNKMEKELIFIEIQNGYYLGEDDMRYQDDYGRK